MFKSLFVKFFKPPYPNTISVDSDRRDTNSRRVLYDTKFLGLGKCIDKRKTVRRGNDQFDEEAYEQRCKDRLGPGWL